jgi:hypothetical protein
VLVVRQSRLFHAIVVMGVALGAEEACGGKQELASGGSPDVDGDAGRDAPNTAVDGAAGSTGQSTPDAGDIGSPCSITSDCRDPLFCAFSRCHAVCETTRDCPGSRCVASDQPYPVCQLPTESMCLMNRDCPAGLICAPDQHCAAQCTGDRDCPVAQRCMGNMCVEPPPMVDGGAAVDASEADVGVCTCEPSCISCGQFPNCYCDVGIR